VAEVAGVKIPDRRIPPWVSRGLGYVVDKVAARQKTAPRLTYKAARLATRKMFFDCSKAVTQLGMPQTPLKDSIARSVTWFREHGYA